MAVFSKHECGTGFANRDGRAPGRAKQSGESSPHSKLLETGRIGISCDPQEWLSEALRMPKLRLVPLTPTLACRSTVLPPLFHDDPADQIIVATAREENATIISKDRLIRDYPHVRTVW